MTTKNFGIENLGIYIGIVIGFVILVKMIILPAIAPIMNITASTGGLF